MLIIKLALTTLHQIINNVCVLSCPPPFIALQFWRQVRSPTCVAAEVGVLAQCLLMMLILVSLSAHCKLFKVLQRTQAIRNLQPLYNRKALSPTRTMGVGSKDKQRGLWEYWRGWGVRNAEYRALAGRSFPDRDTIKKKYPCFFPCSCVTGHHLNRGQ